MQEARAGGRLRAEPGLQGGPARRGRGCQGEKHPKACKLLLSAFFFFFSSCLGGKKNSASSGGGCKKDAEF